MVALMITGLAGVALAEEEQQSGEEQRRTVDPLAEEVVLFDGEVRIPRPSGWEIVKPGDKAVAKFRSTGDDHSQIEVRVSDSVSESRWERYWRAFDTNLRRAGFDILRPRMMQSYGGKGGLAFEYRLEQAEGEYFLLQVWHTHHRDRAWIFSGFYPAERRQAYGADFINVLEQIEW